MSLLRRQQLVLVIFSVALAARLGFVAVRGPLATTDTSEYRLLARNLLHHHAFSMSETPPLQPSIGRPPVYPLFLALLLPLGSSPIIPAIAQAVLDALVAVMIFLMASRVARRPFAVAVSMLYALHPRAISASATLLSETLFTILLLAAVFLALVAAERLSTPLAFCGGAVLGLATLCRSIGVMYVIAVAGVLIVRRFRRTAIAIILGAVVIIVPWLVRSSHVAGRFVFVQAPSVMPWYLPTLWWLDQNDEPALWRYVFTTDPYGLRLGAAKTPRAVMSADDFGRQQAIANIRRNPRAYLRSRLRAFPHQFLSTFDHFTAINRSLGDVVRARDFPALTIKLGLLLLFTALPMAAALLGLAASRRVLTASIAAVMWTLTLAVHAPMWIEYRYFLPVVPFQLVTASLGIQIAIDRIRSRAGNAKIDSDNRPRLAVSEER
jgi:hypothetical protein